MHRRASDELRFQGKTTAGTASQEKTELRDRANLTRDEAISIVAKIAAIAYLDATGEASVLNPHRELRRADVVDELLEALNAHALRPEMICPAEMFIQHSSA